MRNFIVTYKPRSTRENVGDPQALASKMLEMFEDNDDVQNVWHNWENND